MKKRWITLVLACMMTLSLATGAQALSEDGAGNSIESATTISGEKVTRDFYWGGDDMNMSAMEIGADALIFGEDITVNDAKLGGSMRALGKALSFNGVQAENNVTCAGYSLVLDRNCSAAGVYLAGNEVSFSGNCDALIVGAATVTLNGTVNGDASIYAGKVIVGENAVVKGTLHVESSTAPVVAAGASIGKEDYKIDETAEQTAHAVSGAMRVKHALLSRLYWIPATVLLALFFCLVVSNSLENAKRMACGRTVALFVSGAIALLVMPMLLILVCLTYIGLPVAGLLMLLFLLVLFFAVPFAGASAARMVFPKMNVFLAAVIGAAALSALRGIPVLKTIIYFACVLYTLGYFVLVCYDNMKRLGKKTQYAAMQDACCEQALVQAPAQEAMQTAETEKEQDSEKTE